MSFKSWVFPPAHLTSGRVGWSEGAATFPSWQRTTPLADRLLEFTSDLPQDPTEVALLLREPGCLLVLIDYAFLTQLYNDRLPIHEYGPLLICKPFSAHPIPDRLSNSRQFSCPVPPQCTELHAVYHHRPHTVVVEVLPRSFRARQSPIEAVLSSLTSVQDTVRLRPRYIIVARSDGRTALTRDQRQTR